MIKKRQESREHYFTRNLTPQILNEILSNVQQNDMTRLKDNLREWAEKGHALLMRRKNPTREQLETCLVSLQDAYTAFEDMNWHAELIFMVNRPEADFEQMRDMFDGFTARALQAMRLLQLALLIEDHKNSA